jgi:hypothetical protein
LEALITTQSGTEILVETLLNAKGHSLVIILTNNVGDKSTAYNKLTDLAASNIENNIMEKILSGRALVRLLKNATGNSILDRIIL